MHTLFVLTLHPSADGFDDLVARAYKVCPPPLTPPLPTPLTEGFAFSLALQEAEADLAVLVLAPHGTETETR